MRPAAALLLGLLLLLGCPERALAPVEPVWGKQSCAHCAMLVSEKAAAAQVVTADGQRRFFDDPGCMVAWEDREAPRVSARWVRGPGGAGWVDPTTARFSAGHPTPMDFGFLADTDGVTFEQVRAAVREKAQRRPGSPP